MTRSLRDLAVATLVAILGLGCGPKPDTATTSGTTTPPTGKPQVANTTPTKPATKSDAELILGTWTCESITHNGTPVPVNGPMVLKFEGKTADLGGFGPGSPVPFTLDSKTSPKSISLGEADAGLVGVYELNGDNLKLCLAPPQAPKPTAFESKAGSGAILIVAARGKDVAPPKQEKGSDEKDYPAAIVGKWQFAKGETEFGYFAYDTEFTKDGKVLQLEGAPKKWHETGTYRFEKSELVITPVGKDGKTYPDRRYKLTSITADEVVSDSPSGKLKRLK